MLPADPEIIRQAVVYVDSLRAADGTNISEAMLIALHFSGVSQIYLMSDGEPNAGILDFQELRDFIHDRNPTGIRISTMGLCLGEKYKGEPLMKGIAHDTAGSYTYINMSQIR